MKIWTAVIAGIGGTGVITLKRFIEHAALKTQRIRKIFGAEKHGLAQREGSVDVHLRMLILEQDEELDPYYLTSPTLSIGEADLAIGLEPVEILRNAKYTSDKTTFIINDYVIEPPSTISELARYPSIEEITQAIKDISGSTKIYVFGATQLAIEHLQNPLFTNNIILGAALASSSIPIEKEHFEEVMGEQTKDLEASLKALNIGHEYFLENFKT
ncbi:MAG: 2-oxoacid:acceptor oxidoreductase family protein [Candidatus Helarchaeota archaeon]